MLARQGKKRGRNGSFATKSRKEGGHLNEEKADEDFLKKDDHVGDD